MPINDSIQALKKDYYILEVDIEKNRIFLTLRSYWEDSSILSSYISDIHSCIQQLSPSFTILIDLINYKGCSNELRYLHIQAEKLAVKAGLSRIGELYYKNSIIKLFFDTYSKESGAYTMSFEDKIRAEKWLDFYGDKTPLSTSPI